LRGEFLEKFFALPQEKQNTIINAALKCFGTNGYKKTSVSDIAAAAGISKAMVFHYFGTKKDLYFYLVNLCGHTIMDEVNEKFDITVTDFFERIKQTSEIEIAAMKRYSAIPSFLKSVYFEKDEEVKDELKALFAQGEGFRNKIAFDGMDYSKFKEGVDLKLFMKMLMWLTDGYMRQIQDNAEVDYDVMFKEFDECLNMLKNNFYKEEYVAPQNKSKS
jgi:AcrR family transcriptional regulator